ncbi:MAG: gliding motility-associated transport system permease protein [Tepidanaerobacteraceae bacterium]|nr:gliding motility-associated transport system permease protein [Tepidanaerobacteraceae bacterium]
MAIIYSIFKKELKSYIQSPLAYAVVSVIMALAGYFFCVSLFTSRIAEMTSLFMNLAVILIFAVPILTMKLVAGEEQDGTIEFLLTSPITIPQLVLGKYLASLALFIAITILTFIFPGILLSISTPDKGVIITSYLGFLLLLAAYIAIGIMCSSFTSSQIVASISGFGILLLFWIVGWMSGNISGALGQFAKALSISEHYGDFLRGVIDTTHIIYFLSITIVSLLIAMLGVAKRAWS